MSKKKKKQNLSKRIFAYIMLFLAIMLSVTGVLSVVLRWVSTIFYLINKYNNTIETTKVITPSNM